MHRLVSIEPPGPAATEAQLQKIEQLLGVDLPGDYREFLLHTNGGKLRTTEDRYVAFPVKWRKNQEPSGDYPIATLRHLFSTNREPEYLRFAWAIDQDML